MRPKNPLGVVVALFMAVMMVFLGFALGWDDTTRRGMPVWLLGIVGIGAALALLVECWRKPRRNLGDGPVMTSEAKGVLGVAALWYLLPVLAVVIGLAVTVLR